MSLKPKSLKKGDRIGVIAPAGRIFEKELIFAKKWCQRHEWELVYSPDLFVDFDRGYHYAGNDTHRIALTQEMLDDNTIDALWCARGGYGSARIIDDLNFNQFTQNPKWLIGYSDITVFHNYLNNRGICSAHAVTAKILGEGNSYLSYDSLHKILTNCNLSYTLAPNENNILGQTKGQLVGGNLSILYSQLGSPTAIKGTNLILFIEDWYENWYHVDRMLVALQRSGLLSSVCGVIVGGFTKMDVKEENPFYENDFDPIANQVISSFFSPLEIPVAYCFPAGHITDNRALIMGSEVELLVERDFVKLSF